MVDLSVSIVSYNSSNVILNLLQDVFEYSTGLTFQIYVIDNASKDDTVAQIKQRFPQVQVIENAENRGYGAGNNLVLPLIDSRYHLVVNPDIVLRDNILKALVDYMDFHPQVSLSTPRVYHTDGTEQFLPKRQPTIRYMFGGRLTKYSKFSRAVRAEYTRSDETFTIPTEIDFCTGCFMFMRTDCFKQLGGFDEDYFMYLEDADLSYRLQRIGKLMFHPQLAVTHQWEKASAKSIRFLLIHMHSLSIYLRKMKQYKAN